MGKASKTNPGQLTAPKRRLMEFLEGGGCVRKPNDERLKEGHRVYKKGWEVRLVARTSKQVQEVKGLLGAVGLQAGAPYRKSRRVWIVPVYGRDQVMEFLGWTESPARR